MIKDKKIAIVGLGLEGMSAVGYLSGNNKLTVFDDKDENQIDPTFIKILKEKNIELLKNAQHTKNNYDLIIRSPGVRPDNPLILSLIKDGAQITSATNIFFQDCPAQIIGVTGTKGKGTTSTLIYEMLKTAFDEVFLAGNIGTPMLDILPSITKESKVVLELSSFQLMDLKKSPSISVVLMITSEHLDWHKDKDEYIEAKKSIVKFQQKGDYAVINQDFPASFSFSDNTAGEVIFFSTTNHTNGVYIDGEKIISNIENQEIICSTQEVLIPGKHNLQNICASATVAKILNVKNEEIKKVITTFKGLEHRLQLVREINNVKYYNDSFSTTPETTIAAIEAFKSHKILILGGSSKKSDFSLLVEKIASDPTVKKVILIGDEGKTINKLLKEKNYKNAVLTNVKTMKEIVELCSNSANDDDIVILSPACASFDMFNSYKDRGNQFIKEVNAL